MAAVDSLRTHLVEELTDLRDAEEQLIVALPKLARSATAKPLRTAFQKHLAETRGHVVRLNKALRELGEKPTSKTCKGMKGLLSEGESVMRKTPEGALRDAVMITAAQKVEHYEMASYGTARTYAQVLGESSVARLLDQTLREEKAADLTLTKIAEGAVNEDAADEWQSQSEEGLLDRSAEWIGGTARSAQRRMSRGLTRAARATGLTAPRRSRKSRSRGRARRRSSRT
jgi:ferritin-like metal-binding protein YciE